MFERNPILFNCSQKFTRNFDLPKNQTQKSQKSSNKKCDKQPRSALYTTSLPVDSASFMSISKEGLPQVKPLISQYRVRINHMQKVQTRKLLNSSARVIYTVVRSSNSTQHLSLSLSLSESLATFLVGSASTINCSVSVNSITAHVLWVASMLPYHQSVRSCRSTQSKIRQCQYILSSFYQIFFLSVRTEKRLINTFTFHPKVSVFLGNSVCAAWLCYRYAPETRDKLYLWLAVTSIKDMRKKSQFAYENIKFERKYEEIIEVLIVDYEFSR